MATCTPQCEAVGNRDVCGGDGCGGSCGGCDEVRDPPRCEGDKSFVPRVDSPVCLADIDGKGACWTTGFDEIDCKAKYGTTCFGATCIVPVCGDKQIQGFEVCDSDKKRCGVLDADFSNGDAPCKSDCSGYDTASEACIRRMLWTKRSPATSPPARSMAAMYYDAVKQKVVVFGGKKKAGEAGASDALNDMWEWNGTTWSKVTFTGGPGARLQGRMAWDSKRDVAVYYGGYDPATETWHTDTWEWNGATWTQKEASSTTLPPSKAFAMTYSETYQAVVGVVGTKPPAFVKWTGSAWATETVTGLIGVDLDEVAESSLIEVPGGPIVWASVRIVAQNGQSSSNQRVIQNGVAASPQGGSTIGAAGVAVPHRGLSRGFLFGGFKWDPANSPNPNGLDTELDFLDGAWKLVSPASTTKPSARAFMSGAYDAARGEIVIFGGESDSGSVFNETWRVGR